MAHALVRAASTLLWTQGPYDLVSIIEAPSEEAMMGAMANVVAAGNVSSTTMRAFDDKEMGDAVLAMQSLQYTRDQYLRNVPALPQHSHTVRARSSAFSTASRMRVHDGTSRKNPNTTLMSSRPFVV